MPCTNHVHGVLALGQRGQLRLRVVQGHPLPQGPQVTWAALLRTKSTNRHSTTTKHRTQGLGVEVGVALKRVGPKAAYADWKMKGSNARGTSVDVLSSGEYENKLEEKGPISHDSLFQIFVLYQGLERSSHMHWLFRDFSTHWKLLNYPSVHSYPLKKVQDSASVQHWRVVGRGQKQEKQVRGYN